MAVASMKPPPPPPVVEIRRLSWKVAPLQVLLQFCGSKLRARNGPAIEFKYSIMRCVNEIEALCKSQHAKGCCKFKGLNIY